MIRTTPARGPIYLLTGRPSTSTLGLVVTVSGFAEQGFGSIADEFRRNFRERNELGAACAVMVDGVPVVDLWGGHCDRGRTRPWIEDTLVTVFSTTKGMAAAALAVAHSRGLFDLEAPVARYWPEFGRSGKASVTVRQLLAHQAGLPILDARLDVETLADPRRLATVLAAQTPMWTPGTVHGYHPMTLGWYESELLRRVDPDGRRLGRFFSDSVAAPLGVEFHLGLPPDVSPERLSDVVGGGRVRHAIHARETPWPLLKRMINPTSATFKAFTALKGATRLADLNDRRFLELELPSVNGTGTARAVAAVYGDLATGGHRLGLTADTVSELERQVRPGVDQIFGYDSAFSMGFTKPYPRLSFGSSPRAYGHSGAGGSFGFADPDTGVGYAYVMNRTGFTVPTDPRETALRTGLAKALGRALM